MLLCNQTTTAEYCGQLDNTTQAVSRHVIFFCLLFLSHKASINTVASGELVKFQFWTHYQLKRETRLCMRESGRMNQVCTL